MAEVHALIQVMEEVRVRLADPEADFSWSAWLDSDHALKELDAVTNSVRTGRIPTPMLRVLFAPTGPIQEVAISSGWGDEFLALAEKFDSAIATDSTRG